MSRSHPGRLAGGVGIARPVRTWRRLSVGSLIASLGGLALVVALPTAGPARAATATSCSFAAAGTGAYARTLCWFDLSNYNDALARTAAGQSMSLTLPGGYSVSYTLNVSGGAAAGVAFPTYSGAYLGNAGFYTGVAGKPAFHQSGSGTTTVATLSNITVADSNGNAVAGYSLVGADAESTDAGESITWTSSSPLNLISSLGNSCGGGFTGAGTTTVTCRATTSNTKTGTAMLATEQPSTFTQTMVGGGKQAVAFGILVSRVQLSKTVASRVNSTDAFSVSVASASGSVLGSGDTGAGNAATTDEVIVLTSPGGENYTLTESATSGLLSSYTGSWACTRDSAADPTLPSGDAGPSAVVALGVGDFVDCTITNTAKTATLALVKQAGTPTDVNDDGLVDAGDTIAYTFTVTNTGALPMSNVAVADPKVGAVTCPGSPLAAGASEICTAKAAYTVTLADVSAGKVANTATASGTPPGGATPINSNTSSTSTPTVAPAPALTVVKSASPVDVAQYAAGEQITYSFLVTNTGNIPLTNVRPVEGAFTGTGAMSAPNCPNGAARMAPGVQITCTATYIVTRADLESGTVSNTATASGTPPGATTPTVSQPSTVEVPVARLSLVKSGHAIDSNNDGLIDPGDQVDWALTVTNIGTVSVTGISISDPTAGLVSCPATSLAPGKSMTCSSPAQTITTTDASTGSVVNTATATGAGGGSLVAPSSASATVVVNETPAAQGGDLAFTGVADPRQIILSGSGLLLLGVVMMLCGVRRGRSIRLRR